MAKGRKIDLGMKDVLDEMFMDEHTWRQFRADYSVKQLNIRFDLEDEWRNAGKSIRCRAFYEELKKVLRDADGGCFSS